MTLHQLLDGSAQRYPDRVAVVDPERNAQLSYRALNDLTAELRTLLVEAGIRAGDRVGLYGPKSVGTYAALLGVLKAGGVYVPVDPDAPPQRNAFIFSDCAVRAVIVEKSRWNALKEQSEGVQLHFVTALRSLDAFGLEFLLVRSISDAKVDAPTVDAQLAYILYTSGSTGRPKGVMHTHASALSFVDWCSEVFLPTEDDCFSSHAPFHFDLSILDLYVSLKHGSRLILIGEDAGKQPKVLASLIADQGITMWYSTPSILRLLVEYGGLDDHDYSALRVVNFAGEVFPVNHLRSLMEFWPHPRYFNLYGPTETNVCTFYEVPGEIPEERTEPLPIGKACSGDVLKIVDEPAGEVDPGNDGELMVAGGSVMVGYWNLPERTAEAFAVDRNGVRWYKTGDIVREELDGNLTFLGRRDRMVKRRGYRVELGEIEAALHRHPLVREAAVVAVPHEESGVLITAYLSWSGSGRPSTIKLKQFSAGNLPLYMIPDRFSFLPSLPKTSTDKIDYQHLMKLEA